MEQHSRNDYKTARRRAGLTQERWAESIGCSVDSVRGYEAGTQMPSDEIVLAMCEVSGLTALAYWHMRHKSPLAADTLPAVDQLPLPQAVVQLLCAINDFKDYHGDLLTLAADETEALREEARKTAAEKRNRRVTDAAAAF